VKGLKINFLYFDKKLQSLLMFRLFIEQKHKNHIRNMAKKAFFYD
jgi:hypothetical protein